MKKILFFLVASFILLAPLSATVWRVNPDSSFGADFTSIADAISATVENSGTEMVSDGDTLYLEPGLYEDAASITKSITIIGPGLGYGEDELNFSSVIHTGTITLKADNINLIGIRCEYIGSSYYDESEYCNIERCYITETFDCDDSEYLTVKNCYINASGSNAFKLSKATVIGSLIVNIANGFSVRYSTLVNNTFIFNNSMSYTFTDSHLYNNILVKKTASYMSSVFDFGTSNVYNNLIATTEDLISSYDSSVPNNTFGYYTYEDLFVLEGQFSDQYKIKEGHDALTAGTNSSECGAFGGLEPFMQTMRPQGIPYIYDMNLQQDKDNDVLYLNFKSTNQNE